MAAVSFDEAAHAHLKALRVGDVEAQLRYVVERLRLGQLAPDAVRCAAALGDRASQRALQLPDAAPSFEALKHAISGPDAREMKARALVAMARCRVERLLEQRASGVDPAKTRWMDDGDVRVTTNANGWVTFIWLSEGKPGGGCFSVGGRGKQLKLDGMPGRELASKLLWAAAQCVVCPCALHGALCVALDEFRSGWRSPWQGLTAPCLAAAALVPESERLAERSDWPFATLDGNDPLPAAELAPVVHDLIRFLLRLGDPVAELVEQIERAARL
jgi:hypothetical protein